jgi:hypothetical protein
VDHPFWAGRDCDDCERYVYGANGKVSRDAKGLQMLRAEVFQREQQRPPCISCPKCPAGRDKSPTTGRELDGDIWLDLVKWFLEGRAVGFPPDLSPVLAEAAAACAGFLARRAVEEEAQRRARKHVPRPAELVLNWLAFG